MPNVINIRKWIDALTSGEYPQIKDALRTEDGFCCLGVACEVAIENGVVLDVGENSYGNVFYNETDAVLPKAVAEWLGFDEQDTNPNVTVDGEIAAESERTTIALQELNDEYELDFDEIAELIEKEFVHGAE